MHASSASTTTALPPPPSQSAAAATPGGGSRSRTAAVAEGGGGYHRAPLKMPAGSAVSKTPNLGSSGVLARNLSPDKSRRGVASVGGAGDVEMAMRARRGAGEDHDSFTSSSGMYSIGSSEAFDVEDANQRIAAPKVNVFVFCSSFGGFLGAHF